tara:strand:- start:2084 stop:2707 length:624 start_codon:yes stop_codon:yes gene_type:complete
MACNHKFLKYLNLEKLDFQPELLIVGTFNPEWPENNYAEWFYGRTNNNYFWDVLPRMLGQQSLRKNTNHLDWKSFCSKNKIAITDLISSIDDADKNNEKHFDVISKFLDTEFADTFDNFKITRVLEILIKNPSIKKVYFTRNKGVELFDNEILKIHDYCKNNEIYFSYLLTPSANARFQMSGYEPKNPNLKRSLANFIFENWLENWK